MMSNEFACGFHMGTNCLPQQNPSCRIDLPKGTLIEGVDNVDIPPQVDLEEYVLLGCILRKGVSVEKTCAYQNFQRIPYLTHLETTA